MRLSTSNSETDSPAARDANGGGPVLPWGRVWGVAVLALVVALLGWNGFWLFYGGRFSPEDTPELWGYQRRRVIAEGPQAVVLIGSSQMRVGFDQAKFAELRGRQPIQLALGGTSFVPVLRHLSEDETFRGTIISDFPEMIVHRWHTNFQEGNVTQHIRRCLQQPRTSKLSDDLELRLSSYADFLVATPSFGNIVPAGLSNDLGGRKTPVDIANRYPVVYFNRATGLSYTDKLWPESRRQLLAQFQQLEMAALFTLVKAHPPTPRQWLEVVSEIERYVKRINARGGQVIFVHFPFSAEYQQTLARYFPRQDYWDVFAARVPARTIYWADYPALARFQPSDHAHVDVAERPAFTAALVQTIYGSSGQ